jgi:carbon monoxide dehydrogenase subunit G
MPGPIEVSQPVAAPASAVWQVITDLPHWSEVVAGIDSVERLDTADGFGVGTRWRETRTMYGRTATEEMEVTAVEPGRSYTTQARNGSTLYTSVMSVQPRGDSASLLSMTFDAQAGGLLNKTLGAVVGRLMAGNVRKMMQKDLQDIARRAESLA